MPSNDKIRVTFIGAGRMATALAGGMVDSFTDADSITASDPSPQAREAFTTATGCAAVASNESAVKTADIVVIAVKPHYVAAAATQIPRTDENGPLLVSIAAGASLERLHELFGENARIIRVMPNAPALIGCGMSAIVAGSNSSAGDLKLVRAMMETVGHVVEVPESQIDAVTGLSGSGPAYVYQFIEALSDGGVRAGLPRSAATLLAAQTVVGAARMVLETGQHPADLKDAVASPGGTTIAGIHELERGGVRASVMNAVVAAADRSVQLGQSE